MSQVFFGFALADSMFNGDVQIARRSLTVEQVRELVEEGVVPCLNPSHVATISAMKARYGLEVAIPEKAPQVALGIGDSVIVMGVRGLPRLDATRHEYTTEEIDGATFSFSIYTVL